jgi:four helix bundle protein
MLRGAAALSKAMSGGPLALVDGPARFYDIARGSAHECGAILEASKVLGVIDDEVTYAQGKTLLHRIVSMLVKMVT